MTLDDKVGQLVVTSANTTYLSNDTEAFEALVRKVKDLRLGGVHVFGGAEPAPNVLLGNAYGSVILGQPLEAASLLNRLQNAAALPLLNTGDFEAGLGFRINGATTFRGRWQWARPAMNSSRSTPLVSPRSSPVPSASM
jgi:hypothetical protein